MEEQKSKDGTETLRQWASVKTLVERVIGSPYLPGQQAAVPHLSGQTR